MARHYTVITRLISLGRILLILYLPISDDSFGALQGRDVAQAESRWLNCGEKTK